MELRRFSGYVAMMPLGQVGVPAWDWLGAYLAQTIGEKLLFARVTVIPYYELGSAKEAISPDLFMDWEELIRLSEFLINGHIVTGSYVLDEKRFILNIYTVHEAGIVLLAKEEDTRDNFMTTVGRVAQKLNSTFGGLTTTDVRSQIESIAPTRSLEAYEATAAALRAWADGDLGQVREAVERARTLDPEIQDPLDILAYATRELGDLPGLRVAQKAQLARLTGDTTCYKAFALLDEALAYARQMGAVDLEADVLKAKRTLEESVPSSDLSRLYQARVNQWREDLAALMADGGSARLRAARSHGLTLGQTAALYLAAQSWYRQAETSLEVGYIAAAGRYARRAANVLALVGSTAQRQQAKKLLGRIEAALPVPR